MSLFLNLHTHQTKQAPGVVAIQSISLSESTFLAMPKTKPISIGIHPWYGKLAELPTYMKYLTVLAKQDNVKLIGECGLDKRIEIPLEMQILVFKKQLEIVKQMNKPIVLHCVAAFDEVIAIKKELKITNPMIIHGFSKNEQVAKSLLKNDFYLSFGKYLLRNPDLEKVFKFAPENQILLETDTIEESIYQVYEKAAAIKGISVDKMKAIVFTNFSRIFS